MPTSSSLSTSPAMDDALDSYVPLAPDAGVNALANIANRREEPRRVHWADEEARADDAAVVVVSENPVVEDLNDDASSSYEDDDVVDGAVVHPLNVQFMGFRAAAHDFEDDAEEEERGVRVVGEAHVAVEKVD